MEPQDRENAVRSVVSVLRKATRLVQITPFAYLCIYIAYMLLCGIVSDEVLCLADTLFYAMPLTIGGMLVASHLFKLCVWHKAACAIPAISQVEGFVDSYVFTFTEVEIIAINAVIGLSSLVFLVLAIRHFVRGFKRNYTANA